MASRSALVFAFAFALACSNTSEAPPGETVRMDFARPSFFSAPFPSDDLLGDDGRPRIESFPNPNNVLLALQAKELVTSDARGFSTSGGVFFSLTGSIDRAGLPSLEGSVGAAANVFLLGLDDGVRYPAEVAFEDDGGPFGAEHLLSIVPLQGIPLRPKASYAAVVLRALRDATGRSLDPAPELTGIVRGERPNGMPERTFDLYQRALTALRGAGVTSDSLAGMAAFTTGDPTEQLHALAAHANARTSPRAAQFERTDVYDDYCVYRSSIVLPVYQDGAPPYSNSGGRIRFDGGGVPILQREEEAGLVVTVPRRTMPAAGFPTALFVRTGGGGDRPLVDRARIATPTATPTPGAGPAMPISRAGFAGVSVEGPHGGRRNVSKGDEQFLMFNVANGGALRDNVRQSAVELSLLARALASTAFGASDCPGAAATVKFDVEHMVIFGHSMGATIAPLAAAVEPRFGALVLSGAGGSYIENIMHKRKPLTVRPLIELLIGYTGAGRTLTAHDPLLTLLQWALEPADPQVYARTLIREPRSGERPRHVLFFQGIVDRYILPRIANALSLPMGVDLGGKALDVGVAELDGQLAIGSLLPFANSTRVDLPASKNVNGATAVLVQHAEDGVLDGHEIMFQSDTAKRQYQCFLEGFARGAPVVFAGAEGEVCP